ncbi:cytosolic,Fructose-bisphosphate aldolase 6 [Trichinella spiralis]|uniref:Cytosolic,Fructose-bisphosphate aldolase 6 n=1 Tax=Trichinella spiralis TaxID=6334 RepID=A0ABR3K4Q0_TRISP
MFLDWRDGGARTSQHSRWGKKPPSRWRMFRTEQLRYYSPEPAEPKFRLTKSLRCLTTQGKVPACTAERMGPRSVIRVWQRGRPAEVPVFCSVAGGQAESQRLRGGEHGNYVVASCLFDSGSEGLF